jgi:hypothetical protein
MPIKKAMLEKMDAKLEERRAETKFIQAKTKVMRDKRIEASMNTWLEESTADRKEMEAKANPKKMESGTEHREVHKEEAAV